MSRNERFRSAIMLTVLSFALGCIVTAHVMLSDWTPIYDEGEVTLMCAGGQE